MAANPGKKSAPRAGIKPRRPAPASARRSSRRRRKAGGLVPWRLLLLALLLLVSLGSLAYLVFLHQPPDRLSGELLPAPPVSRPLSAAPVVSDGPAGPGSAQQTADLPADPPGGHILAEPAPPPEVLPTASPPAEPPTETVPLAAPSLSPLPATADLPQVALIIDDMGYRPATERQLLALDLKLTFSFIPFTPHKEEMLNLARQHSREILLHLPLEAENEKWNDIAGLLRTTMEQAEIRAGFRAALDEVPTAVGVNNHLGSRFTADPEAMNRLLAALAETELFFLDSRTTGASVATAAAARHGVPFLRRDLFLDNERDETKIAAQLEKLIAIASERGWAVGIAHPYPVTLRVLQQEGPALQKRVRLVSLRELLDHPLP
ncbi:divergent polysaccharide deacetylase family protein [Desulfurivibrio sp. C05AmB]|jgi:uncharacterized protein|uniref:divergent polysaccharide deacetylase family protein n=1 Tax=Desulfurivibrio sp. C05AmB TaxID=3374371 RepID=UPI00376F1BDE